jgi:molybdate transport system substrate-binding protein
MFSSTALRRGAVGIIFGFALVLAACGSSSSSSSGSPAVTLNVFAAASLDGAFQAEAQSFQKTHSNVKFNFSFGGSNTLALQITQGAPGDIFASANTAQMQVVVQGGEADSGSVQTFAHNRLVVITPTGNPANIQTLQDLAKPGVKVVLAAKSVPVGGYALQFLTNASADPTFGASYQKNVLANVVSYETDVKVVFTKVQLGEADAGIVYTSDVSLNGNEVHEIAIPDALNVIATYPIAPLKSSLHQDVDTQFIAFIRSSAGQAILEHYGFIGL